MQRLFTVLSLATVLVWASAAHATSVVIISMPEPSAEMAEALNLLRGELLSVGLAVTTEHRPADYDQLGHDSRRWLEDLARSGASAIVDAVEVDAGLAVDVWVVKTQPLRFEVTRASVDPDTPKAAEVLALRAVEALRAGLLLIDREARRQQQESAKPAPPTVTASAPDVSDVTDVTTERRERLGLDVGGAMLASLDRVGPAIAPMLRLSWAPGASLVVQASVVGAGTRPTVTAPGGTVRVAQHYGTLGACFRLRLWDGRFWPFVTLAAGGLYTAVDGQTDAVNEGLRVSQWSFLLDGALGAGLRIYRRYYMTLAAHLQFAEPYIRVHMAEAVGATSGRPNVAMTLTLGTWL